MNTSQACWLTSFLLITQQQNAEALKDHEGDSISVRHAIGVRVIDVPKVPLNLDLKVLPFNSVERGNVSYSDSRYDLILNMAWLERMNRRSIRDSKP